MLNVYSFAQTTVNDCLVIDLPQVHNRAGNITPIHGLKEIPFAIKRVYYLYDVPSGSERGGHAHKALMQIVVAASGSFTVVLKDGHNEKEVYLNRPNTGLIIIPGIWRELNNFSSGSICLVLASEKYLASDYIREYKEFERLKKN